MKIKNLLIGLSVIAGLLAGLHFLHAQGTTTSAQNDASSLTDTNVDWNSLSDAEVELSAIEAIPPIPYAQLSESNMAGGTYWSAQHSPLSPEPWPPLPANIRQLAVWSLGTNNQDNGVFLLDDLTINYNVTPTNTGAQTMNASADSSGGGAFSPDFSFPTNGFWLQINGVTNGLAYLTLYGTTNGVEYDILSQNALSNAPMSSWTSEGSLFWGSSTTNWTTTTVAQNRRTNLFMAARSWADSTGSGIPDWWWLLYYGQSTNVNPYGDPKGDGWNNLEKFQFGMNPNQFYTPPTPKGLTAVFNSSSSMAEVSWLPSPGPVTGYTIQKYDQWTGQTTNFNLSASVSGFPDTITDSSDEKIDFFTGDYGPTIPIYYQIQAHYLGGDSAWSDPVLLEPNYSSPNSLQAILPVYLIGGSQGSAYLAAFGLPSNTTTLRVKLVDEYAEFVYGNPAFDTTVDIPVAASTNGLYLLSSNLAAPATDSYGQAQYDWFVQTVDANNNPSEPMPLNVGYSSRAVPPYLDGRVQLKQNLTFLLRAAMVDAPFNYTGVTTNNSDTYSFSNPAGYAYAGFYPLNEYPGYDSVGYFDCYWPFESNYRYLNFVFNSANLNSSGYPTTGVGGNYGGMAPPNSSVYVYGLYQELPGLFQFQAPATNGATIPALLGTNQTQWLISYALDSSSTYLGEIGITNDAGIYSMYSNARNIYGLPFLSADIGYNAGGGSAGLTTLYAGGNTTQGGYFYPQTAQPQFQTVEYDFWNQSPVPGKTNFSTGQPSDLIIAAVGNPMTVNGYAKLALLNGYSGVYAYLGQYFDQAYTEDINGMATTNTTGVLSSYGNFFPTVPGPAALVTMPDIDTGQRGTCTVYAISLALDANHDGVMNTNFGGPDNTSQSSPYVFWINNNYDRQVLDSSGGGDYEDDVLQDYDGWPLGDCNYVDNNGNRVIPNTRDLEDFARLWVCGVTSNLLAILPTNCTVTLNWGDVGNPNANNPTIDMFLAGDYDGGIGYLTNATTAARQTNITICSYRGRLGPGGSIQLNGNQFVSGWAGNHFIWCGVSNGMGQLNLTIADGNANPLAQASQWIQIKDIKDMYERWTVGDMPSVAPLTVATNAANDLPDYLQQPFRYATNTVANTPYILFVHGWNNAPWSKDRRAETVFKRLYWQGYQGRFGAFRWPTTDNFNWQSVLFSPDDYNYSEDQAWQSGVGLLNLLTNLDTKYPSHVYLLAHSLGNVVAGEALRLAGTNQVVNTYVASQAALTAHLYDATVSNTLFSSTVTPNIFTNWLASINGGGAGRVISYFNTNDYALGPNLWEYDQSHKPEQNGRWGSYGFYGTPYDGTLHYTPGSVDDTPPWRSFGRSAFLSLYYFDLTGPMTNRYEVMAYADQPRATALGMTAGVAQLINVDLARPQNPLWPPDSQNPNHPYSYLYWHSGEFVDDYVQQQNYWRILLHSTQEGFGL